MRAARVLAAASLGGMLLTMAANAVAQDGRPMVVSDPTLIGQCLCLNHAVNLRSEDVARERQAYDGLSRQIADLANQLGQERAALNPGDPQAVNRLRDRLQTLESLRNRLAGETVPEYQMVVGRYNALVASYTNQCAGRRFDPGLVKSIEAHLTCPAPSQTGS